MRSSSPVRIRVLVGVGTLLLLTGALLAPRCPLLYLPFSHVCHQRVARSFFWSGSQLAICARCLGLYLGLLLATVKPLKLPMYWGWGFVAVSLIEAGIGFGGNLLRFFLGLGLSWCWSVAIFAELPCPAPRMTSEVQRVCE